ncbi:MAG: hypothetical protein WAU07_01615 [Microgenomates group bacterium]
MSDINELNQQESSLNVIDEFVSAYQRLTIYQMQQRRVAVLNNRVYMNGLLDAYIDVKKSATAFFKGDDKKNNKKALKFSTLAKNGKSAAVFLSFETKFSAETVRRTFDYFAESVEQQNDIDLVITGVRGKLLFNQHFPKNKEFTYYDLKESDLTNDIQIPLIKHLLSYEHVEVYHPFFVSILQQKPISNNISGDIPLDKEMLIDRQKRNFLFEPSRQQITHFFEIQIFAALFSQKLKEAHLATLASRITTLQSTEQNLEQERAKVLLKKTKLVRALDNKKQLNRLAGMYFWHRA